MQEACLLETSLVKVVLQSFLLLSVSVKLLRGEHLRLEALDQ